MANTNLSTTRRTAAVPSLVDQFFDDAFFQNWMRPTGEQQQQAWFPPVDLSQTTDKFMVKVDLPGMTAKDIEVTVENQTLTLRGERKLENSEEGETFNRVERVYGRFTRTFQLPSNVDAAKVSATFKDGVLFVEIPKSEAAKSRRIEIR
jgi:HSP20 family protein